MLQQGHRIRTAIVLVCALGALALPGTASGATASISGGTLHFDAASGETNDVTIETDAGVFRVVDNVAPVTAGAGCNQRSVHRVNCPIAGVTLVQVILADGDDSIQTLIGTVNADLRGGNGSDLLLSSDGNDTLRAGKGRANATEFLSGAGGNDTLLGAPSGTNGGTNMNGGPGNDDLLGGTSQDGLFGDLGADVIEGGPNFDFVSWSGVAGITVTVGAGANDGEAGEGDDVAADIESISGTFFNDSITGGPISENIFTGSGKDTIIGSDGDDFLDGGDGADDIDGGNGSDFIQGGPRADDIFGGNGVDVMGYGDHSNAVTVTINNVANDGQGGGSEGDNVHTDVENLAGTSVNDTLIGSGQDNVISGQGGNDNIQGVSGEDELFGDSEFGGFTTGNDDLSGDAGDDTMFGGPGDDDYDGGPGFDFADYSRPVQTLPDLAVSIDNVANDGVTGSGEADNVMDTTEGIVGNQGNDVLVGSPVANTLLGGGGGDTLQGGSGPDMMDGETPGFFTFTFGADTFLGGAGLDTVSYASHGFTSVQVDIGGGPDGSGAGAENDDVQSTIENLIGGDGSDTLTGNDQPNTLAGRNGSDLLTGAGAADHLAGNGGFDTHEGQGGKDEINSRNDGSGDIDNCGTEADTAIADPFDTVNADCENVIP